MKLNILILEDEYFIRKSLVQKVSRCGLSIASITDVETTEEATDIITTTPIDIFLCDLHLGNDNGLDFIEFVKSVQPNIKVIIISGHGDFKYAKRAIDLEVRAYILKPVATEELFAALKQANEALQKDRETAQKDFSLQQRYVETDVRNAFQNKDLKTALSFFPHYRSGDQFGSVYVYLPELSEQETSATANRLINALKPYQVQEDFLFFEVCAHEFCCVFSFGCDGNKQAGFPPHLQQCWQELYPDSAQKQGSCAGVSAKCDDVMEAYWQSYRAMRHHIFLPQTAYIFFEQTKTRNHYQLPDEDKILFEYAVKSRKYTLLCEFLDAFYETTLRKEMRYSYFQLIYHYFMQNILFQLKMTNPTMVVVQDAYRFATVHEALGHLKKLFLSCIGQTEDDKKQSAEQLVYGLKNLIDRDYAADISLERFCFTHKVNPSFLSQQFKLINKISFQDYLIQVRISNAKLLLSQNRYKVKEIAEMCGFANQHYFSNLFKKRTGLSPKEYHVSCTNPSNATNSSKEDDR